jgi:hypothetical protein
VKLTIIKHLRLEWFRYGFETLAVVIGILAAFALENWNDERKSADQTSIFLNNISSNLSEDIEELQALMVHLDTSIIRAESLITSYKQGSFNEFDATVYIGWLNVEKSFHVNRSGIDALINSGRLDLLSPDLTYALQQYYALCEKLAEREAISNGFIQEKYEPYYFDNYMEATRLGDVYGIPDKYVDDPREQYLINEQTLLEDKRMEIFVLIRLVHSESEQGIYLKIIKKAEELRSVIQQS